MADKRFPSDLTNKVTPVNEDTILISDSEGLGSEPVHGSKYTTIENLVNMVGYNLDISGKADKVNVLELTQIDAFNPTGDYHPSTKIYTDTGDAAVVAYVDSELAGHVVDFHALSGTHIGDTIALSAAIDTVSDDLSGHMVDVENPHVVTQTQVGLSAADNTSDADKPISTATQVALDLKADVTTTDALSASIDLLEIGSKVSTLSISGTFLPDITNYNHFDVTVTGDIALGPIGGVEEVGQNGMLILQQDAIGGHTITFATPWQFPAGAPVENTTANAFNVFRYTVLSTNNILCEFIADYIEV